MRNVILIVIAVLAAAVVVPAIAIAMRPSEFRVSRSTTVAAAPEIVFAQVNDFRKWDAWNPWAKIDPDMSQTYEGESAGEGAVYTWAGDKNVGEGRMTIEASQPYERIEIQLEFMKPFAGTNTAEFTFEPDGEGTTVTWSMHGTNGFMAKAIGLFMDMDKMIGGNFEQGLADMKAASESAATS